MLAQFQDPLIYLLLVAVGISFAALLAEGAEGLPIDAIVILAVVVLNAVIGLVEQSKADDAVAALSTTRDRWPPGRHPRRRVVDAILYR